MLAAFLSAPAFAANRDCVLTPADKMTNAALSFEDLDQRGTVPSTTTALNNRGCRKQAVEAMEHYLINGPVRTDREQRIILWHMAQSLALAGQESEAARLMTATRTPDLTNDRFDWDSYVSAGSAFLIKGRAAFDKAAATLASSVRPSDVVNSGVVAAMGRCWKKQYSVAYDATCGN